MSPNSEKMKSGDNDTRTLTPCFVYFNLTICCLTTMYRAYEHSDTPVIAFVVAVYVAYFVLDKCHAVYKGLPEGEESLKKEVLKFTLWGLSSGILLGFAYQFGLFMNLIATLLIYASAIASSALLFYSYYIYADQNRHPMFSSCVDDKSNKHAAPISDNV